MQERGKSFLRNRRVIRLIASVVDASNRTGFSNAQTRQSLSEKTRPRSDLGPGVSTLSYIPVPCIRISVTVRRCRSTAAPTERQPLCHRWHAPCTCSGRSRRSHQFPADGDWVRAGLEGELAVRRCSLHAADRRVPREFRTDVETRNASFSKDTIWSTDGVPRLSTSERRLEKLVGLACDVGVKVRFASVRCLLSFLQRNRHFITLPSRYSRTIAACDLVAIPANLLRMMSFNTYNNYIGLYD